MTDTGGQEAQVWRDLRSAVLRALAQKRGMDVTEQEANAFAGQPIEDGWEALKRLHPSRTHAGVLGWLWRILPGRRSGEWGQ